MILFTHSSLLSGTSGKRILRFILVFSIKLKISILAEYKLSSSLQRKNYLLQFLFLHRKTQGRQNTLPIKILILSSIAYYFLNYYFYNSYNLVLNTLSPTLFLTLIPKNTLTKLTNMKNIFIFFAFICSPALMAQDQTIKDLQTEAGKTVKKDPNDTIPE